MRTDVCVQLRSGYERRGSARRSVRLPSRPRAIQIWSRGNWSWCGQAKKDKRIGKSVDGCFSGLLSILFPKSKPR
ncbi:hypothetical protein BDN70DRAFT_887425 [Pholiota conissans]|uniref:Uncharacterized protein n=1 Tax=Pholiota conissans TaxID=109636 RepID=A0A9P6CSG0_9AGAR|nr:hypothetical protein BDN70DRAFT_887425 [Pholiota conissans]